MSALATKTFISVTLKSSVYSAEHVSYEPFYALSANQAQNPMFIGDRLRP